MTFLHGVETIEYQNGPITITTAATGVIGLVGTCPIQTVLPANQTANTPVLITNSGDAALYFGEDTPGYTIPSALNAILAAGTGPVIVVNVLDPADVSLQTAGVPDPTNITSAHIIGTTTMTGQRTGLLSLLDSAATYGFKPKQIICPGFTTLAGVQAQMDVIATKVRGICWVDAPLGLTPAAAITARGVSLNFSSKRTVICYPAVKAVDGNGDTVLLPFSQFAAAGCAAKDQTNGYWWSPSNTVLASVIGMERPIDGTFQDPASDLNLLNASGICAIYSGFGLGYRMWGNRSSAFPASNEVDTFIPVRRTADAIEDAIEAASLPYMDRPITKALIDLIVASVNDFIRTLIGRGALVDGNAFYDATQNPSSELSNGHLTVSYQFMPPAPLERLTYQSFLNVSLYQSINGTSGN